MRQIESYPGRAFSATADPELFFASDAACAAEETILGAIRARSGVATLVAPAGLGKTMLLKKLARDLAAECRVAVLGGVFATSEELVRRVSVELGADPDPTESIGNLLTRLTRHLCNFHADTGACAVVFFDDAHLMDERTLLELRLLADIGNARESLLQVVLCGDERLDAKLRSPSLALLEQCVVARATLQPLLAHELPGYLHGRFAGEPQRAAELFDARDLERILAAACGVPRTLNTICDNALILAFARGRWPVTEKDVDEAIRTVIGRKSLSLLLRKTSLALPRWTSARRFAGPVLTACVSFAVGLAIVGMRAGDSAALADGARTTAAAAVVTDAPVGGARSPVSEKDESPAPAPQRTLAQQALGQALLRRPGSRVPTLYPLGFGPHCGDAYLDEGEECDDGNAVDSDECLSNCHEPVCGDGVIHAGVEECDDGNTSNDDGCLFGCLLPRH